MFFTRSMASSMVPPACAMHAASSTIAPCPTVAERESIASMRMPRSSATAAATVRAHS